MLPESYFNGERLRMYLQILEEYKASTKEEAKEAVEEKKSVVVHVENYSENVKEQDLFIAEEVDNISSEVIFDFSISSEYNAKVEMLFSLDQVEKNVKPWSKVIKCDFERKRKIRVINGQWSKYVRVESIFLSFHSRKSEENWYKGKIQSNCFLRSERRELLCYVQHKLQCETGFLWQKCSSLPIREIDKIEPDKYLYFPVVESSVRAFLVKFRGSLWIMRADDLSVVKFKNESRMPDFVVDGYLRQGKGYFIHDLVYASDGREQNYFLRKSKLEEIRETIVQQGGKGLSILEGKRRPHISFDDAEFGLLMLQPQLTYDNENRWRLQPSEYMSYVYVQEYFNSYMLLIRGIDDDLEQLSTVNYFWLKYYVGKVILVEERNDGFELISESLRSISEISRIQYTNVVVANIAHFFSASQFRRLANKASKI